MGSVGQCNTGKAQQGRDRKRWKESGRDRKSQKEIEKDRDR
jgi:hypothetical protein